MIETIRSGEKGSVCCRCDDDLDSSASKCRRKSNRIVVPKTIRATIDSADALAGVNRLALPAPNRVPLTCIYPSVQQHTLSRPVYMPTKLRDPNPCHSRLQTLQAHSF